MKRIDRDTVSRILDTVDIVEVVSDFVTLRRRGANYIGLCPFHSERTPSFSVSKSKGICKCFSCGKGGSAVNFLMELEQMSYQEALRWLARKYGIPIVEQEESEEEKRAASLREAYFAVNSFALKHFEKNLHETDDGKEIGLAYFLERGLAIDTVKRFHLGYALEDSTALFKDAVKAGYSEENLIATGLCAKAERGVYDRFRGRVIFPVHSISGKIVAFGGRTLRSDKKVAKYVNSPESEIYSKSRELYGLYQARRSVVKEDKCILVEGYMDVISMSQAGVENVVASSGTSLTSQQVNLIHRFTENVVVIYDADPAGIKASLRGVDMLLSEGMNVKVVLFPPGEDPDSFARSHTKEELADYLMQNEMDFIEFKTSVLLRDTENDPVGRSHAIADILRSIAVIPDPITRQVYIEKSARTFGMEPKMLALEVKKGVDKIAENAFVEKQRNAQAETTKNSEASSSKITSPETATDSKPLTTIKAPLYRYEKSILRLLLRYGMMFLCNAHTEDGDVVPVSVLEYVRYELEKDNISFSDPLISILYLQLIEKAQDWDTHQHQIIEQCETVRKNMMEEGLESIRLSASSVSDIAREEIRLKERIDTEVKKIENEAKRRYFEKFFLSDPDDNTRRLVTELVSDRHELSKVHSKYGHVETEEEKLTHLVARAVFELKDAILRLQISELSKRISQLSDEPEKTKVLMTELMEKMKIKSEFARYLGDRIITPPII